MVALETPICDFGWKAPDFNLKGIDQKNIVSLILRVKMEL